MAKNTNQWSLTPLIYKSSLGSTNDGKQGSTSWITGGDRIEKAVESDSEARAILNSVKAGRTETWVVRTMPDGSTKVQVLDGAGNVKKVTEDVSKILKMSSAGGQP